MDKRRKTKDLQPRGHIRTGRIHLIVDPAILSALLQLTARLDKKTRTSLNAAASVDRVVSAIVTKFVLEHRDYILKISREDTIEIAQNIVRGIASDPAIGAVDLSKIPKTTRTGRPRTNRRLTQNRRSIRDALAEQG